MNTKNINIVLLALLFSLALLVSCNKTATEGEAKQTHEEEGTPQEVILTDAQYKRAKIELGKVENRNLSATLPVNGVLDVPPQNLVTVSAVMGGFVKSTHIIQGMKVKKGEVLAVIENPAFISVQREYLENKQKLKYLEQEYKRQEELSRENVAATKTFQQVSADYNSMLATNGALEAELRLLNISPSSLNQNNISSTINIYAPIEGYITAVNVNIGKYINPQDVIFEIVDTKHLHVELTVFEKDVTKIKIGQKIRFVLINESNKERTGTVYLIDHKVQQDRTVRIHAHMDKEDPALLPNMYLKAVIEIDDQEVMTVPDQSVVSFEGKYYIYIPEAPKDSSHTFKAVEVQKGISQNGYTEIISENNPSISGAVVVTNGAYSILAKLNNKEEEEGHAH